MQERMRSCGLEELLRIPRRREMQGDENGNTWWRQIVQTIDAVKVNDVNLPSAERVVDRSSTMLGRSQTGMFIQAPARTWDRQESTGGN